VLVEVAHVSAWFVNSKETFLFFDARCYPKSR